MAFALILVVACYLIGSIPFPVMVSRLVRGIDLREHGSGNMGAMNAARVLGKRWFPVVFGLDLAKGAAAAFLARTLLPGFWPAATPLLGAVVGGFFVVLGHCFPLFVRFRGGVGLAASAGALLVVSPWLLVLVGLAILPFWALTRNMYVGVACAALLLPVLGWLLFRTPELFVALLSWGLLVFAVHWKDVHPWLNGVPSERQ